MGITVFLMKGILPSARLSTVLEILAGVLVFILIAFLDHAITKEDLRSFRRRR